MKILWLFIALVPVIVMLNAYAFDYELSTNTFFEYKGHLNRAVHAATLQRDEEAFSSGKWKIDFNEYDPFHSKAFLAFEKNLMTNMRLEKVSEGKYVPNGGPVENEVRVPWFEVYNGECDSNNGCSTFTSNGVTYVKYVKPEYDFETVLSRPGVMTVVEIDYKEVYGLIGDVKWNIKASHEIVY